MKITGNKYETMRQAMRAVVEYHGLDKIHEHMATSQWSNVRLVWFLWGIAYNNLQYDDSHPAYVNKTWVRIHPYNPTFKLYENGENDSHIQTALLKIGKELGLCQGP